MRCKKKFCFLIFLVVIFIFPSCALRRIPNPTTDSNMDFNLPGGGSRISPHDNYSPGWENSGKIGENIKGQVVKVPGVKNAAVVVYNTSAYIGIETDENGKTGEMSRGGNQSQNIINQVAKKAKETEGSIATVYVSSDENFMQKINDISDSIRNGTAKGNFKNEIDELVRGMSPIE